MDEEESSRTLIIFGRDVSTIPCFRKSFLYGFTGGIVCGLAAFMLTSKPRIASHTGMGSFVIGTWSYWMTCRYKWTVEKLEAERLQELMRAHTSLEGTPAERKSNLEKQPVLVDA